MTEAVATSARDTRPRAVRYTLFDKLLYGAGSVSFGVKDNGFTVLLMIFYNQALGMPASQVGLAVMIALILDAVSDPLVGAWSDRFRSRWGRRHPFMYAAALPVAISYWFLWNPPRNLDGPGLFAFLLVNAIVIRQCITLYEIPSSAMVTDLTRDYDERTQFLSYRYFFGWAGSLSMGVAAFSLFLTPTDSQPVGQLNLDGYSAYGLTASLIMFASIMISALGTHRHVAGFAPLPPKRPIDWRRSVREVVDTLGNRAFLTILGATLFSFMATGVSYSLLTYFRIYFWQLSGDQISLLLIANMASIATGLVLAPRIARRVGKKRAALTFGLISICTSPALYLLRLADLLPANGSTLLLALLMLSAYVGATLAMMSGVVGSSMLADVVEESQLRTGLSSAGLIFSSNAFVQKAISGVGLFLAGLILDFVAFPANAKSGAVPADVLRDLVLVEVPTVMALQLGALLFLLAYPITRSRHDANVNKLASAPLPAD